MDNAENTNNVENKRATRCCFTGHRSQKLTRPIDDIKVDLENEILAAIKEGYTTFITGMAYGTDIWAGNIVVRLKSRFPDLKLIAAIPFQGFDERWDTEWREQYGRLLESADLVKIICKDLYSNGDRNDNHMAQIDHTTQTENATQIDHTTRIDYIRAYQLRNEWMVDHSSKCIAVYNGTAGGTRNTINYAKKNKVFVKYVRG